MQKFYKTTGLIYKTKNFKDNDKLVWILTGKKGKIGCIAKGIRKVKSRKAGHVDLLNYNKLSLYEGRNLDILKETTCINNFQELKTDFTYELFYIAELIDKIEMEESEAALLLRYLIEFLEAADKNTFNKLLISFEIKLMKLIGFEPNLKSYLDTEEQLSTEKKIYLNQTTPGYVSDGISSNLISPNVIKCQRFCINASANATIALKIEPEMEKILLQINKIWIQTVLDRRLKSLEYIN